MPLIAKENPSSVVFPFSAIVGQEEAKLGLILNVIDPTIGGVLLMGHRGTGKSTAVRALADLLPAITVSSNCQFNCDPTNRDALCVDCAETLLRTGKLGSRKTTVPVVDLPLGATEDRVCGSIDIQRALAEGVKAFEPGLLARANRGFLYIDEVNLLEDHLVDLLLDVAVTGRNKVERENISIEHPAEFVLVGSGNPEEGDLRPQLIDRFGLYAEVRTENAPEQRMEIVSRRDEFDRNRSRFVASFEDQQHELQRRIKRARKVLSEIRFENGLLEKIGRICAELKVEGHRGELTVMRAARALAAFSGRKVVKDSDARRVAGMALRHRLHRDAMADAATETKIQQALDSESQPVGIAGGSTRVPHNPNDNGSRDGSPSAEIKGTINSRMTPPTAENHPRFNQRSGGSSSRAGATELNFQSGRYVQSRPYQKGVTKIAIDATLRAMLTAGNRSSMPAIQDYLRFKRFARKQSTLFIFAIDTSGSMATARIRKAKGAVLNLLKDSYVNRDNVAIIAFRGDSAELLLPPSRSIIRARRVLDSLSVGGATPLSAGLKCSLTVAERESARYQGRLALLLFTDGGANMPLALYPENDRDARREAIQKEVATLGARLHAAKVQVTVVNSNLGFGSSSRVELLANLLNAQHVVLQSPSQLAQVGPSL